MKQNALLIIDPQNDFCNQGDNNGKGKGALYVDGAENDMANLSKWIKSHTNDIDFIAITVDAHQVNDISHPSFWVDKNGNFPDAFTQISAGDVEIGKWNARFEAQKALDYLKALEEQGEYPHVIWAPHCLIGSTGAAIYQPLMDAIVEWALNGKFYEVVSKGKYPFTEHFGAFRAQIPVKEQAETQLNTSLIETLNEYQNIYLAGEAKSHCVASSLKQIMEVSPALAAKFIVLEDTMSNVTGFETIADPIYDKAKQLGVRFSNCKAKLL